MFVSGRGRYETSFACLHLFLKIHLDVIDEEGENDSEG